MTLTNKITKRGTALTILAASSLLFAGHVSAGGHSGAPKNLTELIAAAKKRGPIQRDVVFK